MKLKGVNDKMVDGDGIASVTIDYESIFFIIAASEETSNHNTMKLIKSKVITCRHPLFKALKRPGRQKSDKLQQSNRFEKKPTKIQNKSHQANFTQIICQLPLKRHICRPTCRIHKSPPPTQF